MNSSPSSAPRRSKETGSLTGELDDAPEGDGKPPVDSATLDARQNERNRFVVASYQGALNSQADYQISVFNRVTDVHYRPDAVGDLQFNGISADILRRNDASGVQADLSYRLNPAHTLRAGLFAQQ